MLPCKVAWITGGTRGLGRAVSAILASEYNLALSYLSDDGAACQAQSQLQEQSGRAPLLLRGDLSRDDVAKQQIAEIVGRYGGLHTLVHCIALASFKPLISLNARELRRTVSYSFEALHHVMLAAVDALIAKQGSVVVVSSIGARRTLPGYAALGAAKAALESYSRHLAVELGPKGVRVNVVSPGVLQTESLRWVGLDEASLDTIRARTPLGRLVSTDEVGKVIRFLLSPEASAVTAQTITVDGGYDIVA